MGRHITLALYSPTAIEQMTAHQLADSLDYAAPDIVLVPEPHHEHKLRHPEIDHAPETHVLNAHHQTHTHYTINDIDLLCLAQLDDLSEILDLERTGGVNTRTETFLLSDLLKIKINPTNLATTLEGSDAYKNTFPHSKLDGSYTHITTHANPDYRNTWNGLTVQGLMPGANTRQGHTKPEIVIAKLTEEGIVSTDTVGHDKFGLRGVSQVGRTRAETLRENGITHPETLTDTPVHELMDLNGFGRSTAETITQSARALTDGEVIRTGDDGFPGPEPIFIDIETDGLTPTMVWLIGVLDREQEPAYRSFIARDPDDKGKAIEAFMSWFTSTTGNRPVVAYNGKSFDFPVIEDHINQHCPTYLGDWENAWTFDPYFWAVTQNNAILPGRTNKLEDVASALGRDTDDTGLDGATVGRKFQQYLANPGPETALDWDRHEAYCEDDVRALAHVYDALADAGTTTTDTDSDNDPMNTAQGTLADF